MNDVWQILRTGMIVALIVWAIGMTKVVYNHVALSTCDEHSKKHRFLQLNKDEEP